jgi:hypothetical protein
MLAFLEDVWGRNEQPGTVLVPLNALERLKERHLPRWLLSLWPVRCEKHTVLVWDLRCPPESLLMARLMIQGFGLIDRAQTLEAQRYADLAQLMMGMSGLNAGGLQLSGTNMANAGSMYQGTQAGYGNIANQWGQILQGLGQGTGYQQNASPGVNLGQQQPYSYNPTNQPFPRWYNNPDDM